jgi:8-oxo-dGTP pyrophosphatase MutT (NUDIX family)
VETVHFEAAGGVLYDGDRVLVLRSARYGDLRLPKGHIKDGESTREAALREVAEESGYIDIEAIADLGEQDVEYDVDERHIIRHEHYYMMRLLSPRQGKRPIADWKFRPEWLTWDEAIADLEFDEERRWLVQAREIWASHSGGETT